MKAKTGGGEVTRQSKPDQREGYGAKAPHQRNAEKRECGHGVLRHLLRGQDKEESDGEPDCVKQGRAGPELPLRHVVRPTRPRSGYWSTCIRPKSEGHDQSAVENAPRSPTRIAERPNLPQFARSAP